MLVEKIGHVEADWFGAKICLAKILALIWLESKEVVHLTKYLSRFWQKTSCQYFGLPYFGKANFSTKPIRLVKTNNLTLRSCIP